MKYIFCPNCQSGNTHELIGTDYRACENCGRLDYEKNFRNFQAGGVPVKFHQNLKVEELFKKTIYGKSQYEN